jgi:branched-chain amino acid transport system substrate-binding protein
LCGVAAVEQEKPTMKNAVLRVAAVAAMLVCLGTQPSHAQEELKIGGIGPLSGGGTAWGLAVNRGVLLAVGEVNAAGGLKVGDKTYKLRLIMLDDTYSATGGRTAADRLISLEKVKYIIGPVGSPSVLGALSATDPSKTLLFSDGFAINILKNDSHAAYNFRAVDTTIEFAPSMVQWLRKNHPEVKKVGMLGPNDATGQAVLPMLTGFYKANGIDVWTDSFDRGTQEFVPLITRMMAQGVDLIDLNSNSPGDAGLMLKQARQAGYKGLIWQIGGPSVAEIMAVAGPLAEGFLSLEVFDFSSAAGQKFTADYHAQWPGIVNAQSPLYYNAAKILFEALRRAGGTEVDKVRDSLAALEGYDAGVIGPVIWGGQADYGVNHQLLVPFWIAGVKGGQETMLVKITPEKR